MFRAPARGASAFDPSVILTPVVEATGRHDLSVMTHEIRAATEGQLTLLEHMGDSLAELTASAGTMADGARQSALIAEATTQRARHGGEMVRRLSDDLDNAVTVAQVAIVTIDELAGQVSEASKLAEVIQQIASRTRLVALNATIEAARAGEQGAAFAVVAHEVQSLAEQAARAAAAISEIARSVEDSTARSSSSSDAMGEASQRMVVGLRNAAEAGYAFEGIITDVTLLCERIDDSAAASADQVTSSRALLDGARGITAAARSTVASADVLARTTGQLERALDTGAAGLVRAGDPLVAAAHEEVAHALRPLFDVPREHAGRYVALLRTLRATHGHVTTTDLDALDEVMRANLARFPDARGATVTVVPDTLSDQYLHMHWWVSEAGVTSRLRVQLEPGLPDFYDYRQADWYRTPVLRRRTWLSDPYFDEGGAEADIVTISVPAVDEDTVVGVATADIGLGQIASLCGEALAELDRPAALVTSSGVVVCATASTGLVAGQRLDKPLASWVGSCRAGWTSGGPGREGLSLLPTLDWGLLTWSR